MSQIFLRVLLALVWVLLLGESAHKKNRIGGLYPLISGTLLGSRGLFRTIFERPSLGRDVALHSLRCLAVRYVNGLPFLLRLGFDPSGLTFQPKHLCQWVHFLGRIFEQRLRNLKVGEASALFPRRRNGFILT